MRIRDLGPLVVAVDGGAAQPVAGTRGAAILATLAIHVNQHLSADALMHAAWGERVTAGAGSTLLSHIWRLRQLLEPDRATREAPSVLVNDAGGYRLVAGPSSLDSLALVDAAQDVRHLLAAGHAETGVRRAESALALWRGRPYGPLADADWAQPAVERWEELRRQLQEQRIGALLTLRSFDLALADLQPLIAIMPFRESLRGLQMEALYRTGRTDEALEVYRATRRALIDEIGIEPGPDLQDLHRRILDQDVSLLPPARPVVIEVRDIEVHLPPTPTPLIGREQDTAAIAELLAPHRLVTISGTAGCGKTRLAIETARTSAFRFADGVWFVELAAVSEPDLVVDVIVSTIGFAPSPGTTPLEDLRRYLQSRRTLLVLDNCEHVLTSVSGVVAMVLGDVDQDQECRFLATSREPLGVAGEVVWPLDPLGLPGNDHHTPATAPAVQLFRQRLRQSAPKLVLDDAALADVVAICTALDGLPLPLELAAARAASYTLSDIATQVREDPSRLARIGRGPADHRATVASTIEWSHRLLPAPLQLAHRRLSVLTGPFTPQVAEAVMADQEPSVAADRLAELVHRSMLTSAGARRPGRPTAFRQLATVRSHARHALQDSAELITSLDRRDAWTAALLADKPALGDRSEPAWYQRVDDDYATVRASLTRGLIESPSPRGARSALRLGFYWYHRERLVEGTRWMRLSYDVLRGTDDLILATVGLAATLAIQGRGDEARPYLDELLAHPEALDAAPHVEVCQLLIGLVGALWLGGAQELVVAVDRLLVDVLGSDDSPHLQLLAEACHCMARAAAGDVPGSIEAATEIRSRATPAGVPMASWMVAGPPMAFALYAGRPEDGIGWVNRCLHDHVPFGTGASAIFIETRADFAVQAGDLDRAVRCYGASYAVARRVGTRWPWRELSSDLLARTRQQLSAEAYERAWRSGEQLTLEQVLDLI